MKQVGIFGKRKSGKSALMYALTRQKQDAAFSAMEIGGVTKVMLVDTVGVDVEESTAEKSAQTVEVALMLITDDSFELEMAWINKLRKAGIKILAVIAKSDLYEDGGKNLAASVGEVTGIETMCVSAEKKIGIVELDEKITQLLKDGK
ncbi:MAG: 50S ribosome-binding GTPase [Selenomonadaceae bacterium]|nr:50S ribosome-binding GTPase [Selenomonadaceae bacterium]